MTDLKKEDVEAIEVSDVTKRVFKYVNYENKIYMVTFTDDLLITINKNNPLVVIQNC